MTQFCEAFQPSALADPPPESSPNACHNYSNSRDVSGDGFVSAYDVKLMVLRLDYQRAAEMAGKKLPAELPVGPPYYDVDNDGHIAPIDALLVINMLNDD